MKPNVAIVGRPNVGKSTIFNRILGRRKAIVLDTPGVTRDRNYGTAEWNGKSFNVIDTGGIDFSDGDFNNEINNQVNLAIADADVIVFVVDGKTGITDQDAKVGKMILPYKNRVILAVNKADNETVRLNAYEFYSLGLEELVPISAVHGTGIGDLLDLITNRLPIDEDKENEDSDKIKISIIGEPNVGKSSLVNKLIGDDRLIVSPLAGTTRDSISLNIETSEGQKYKIIDTAGIRKPGKVREPVEKFSVIRAKEAVDDSDVSLVLIDADLGIREQDKKVAGVAFESGKGIIIVVNKWDLIEKDNHTMKEFEDYVRNELPYLNFAPIIFISAKTGIRIDTILPLVDEIYNNSIKRIPSSLLNEVLFDAVTMSPPAAHKGKILRLFYLTQVEIKPPLFIVFVNDIKLFHFSYERYLINYLRNVFDFKGIPIKIKARERS